VKFVVVFNVGHTLGRLDELQPLVAKMREFEGVEKVYVGLHPREIAVVIINADSRDAVDALVQYAGLSPMQVLTLEYESDANGRLVAI